MAVEYAVRQARGFDRTFGLDKLEMAVAMANVALHYPEIKEFPFKHVHQAASEATSQYLDAVRRLATNLFYRAVEIRVAEFHQDLSLAFNYNEEAFARVKTALIDLDDCRLKLVPQVK
ncbi:hypothetical protein HYV80_05430 [Candidatus Woesearchaeota archaeon]|nr:hypothetical protein [Candidatus Woesearchaeota archaeon]